MGCGARGKLDRPLHGTVYFLECASVRRIKIGYSTGSGEVRRYSLQLEFGEQMRVLHEIHPASLTLERMLHGKFSRLRVPRSAGWGVEWYQDDGTIREWIAAKLQKDVK